MSTWGRGTLFLTLCRRAFVPTTAAPLSLILCAGDQNQILGLSLLLVKPPCSWAVAGSRCAAYLIQRFNCCHGPVQRQGSGRWGGGDTPHSPTSEGEPSLNPGEMRKSGKGEILTEGSSHCSWWC